MIHTKAKLAVSLEDAARNSPVLGHLKSLMQTSAHYLGEINHLLPAGLKNNIQPGPIEDGVWCLLVSSTSSAAKLRQLLPDLKSHLQSEGHYVQSIRIKVLTP